MGNEMTSGSLSDVIDKEKSHSKRALRKLVN